MIEITSDGQITENELKDFARIQIKLNEISSTVEALKLWVKEMIATGSIDEEEYENALQESQNNCEFFLLLFTDKQK